MTACDHSCCHGLPSSQALCFWNMARSFASFPETEWEDEETDAAFPCQRRDDSPDRGIQLPAHREHLGVCHIYYQSRLWQLLTREYMNSKLTKTHTCSLHHSFMFLLLPLVSNWTPRKQIFWPNNAMSKMSKTSSKIFKWSLTNSKYKVLVFVLLNRVCRSWFLLFTSVFWKWWRERWFIFQK